MVEKESAGADMLFASEQDAVDKLEAARQHQDGALEVLDDCRKNMDGVFREFSNCRALHEAWFDAKEAGRRHSEPKRKAEEAHTRTCLQRECIRRATRDHVKTEEVLNNSVGCLGTLVKDTTRATQALTCGVLDRESNETKYLKEAPDMINDWQSRCSRRSSEDHADQDITEVVLVERPQL